MLGLDQQMSTPWSVFFIWLIIPSFLEMDNFLGFFTYFLPQSRGDGLKVEPLTHLSVYS